MDTDRRLDINFDFRSDTPGYPKNDPDALSPTLRRYHRILSSKPLQPASATRPAATTSSSLGEFVLIR